MKSKKHLKSRAVDPSNAHKNVSSLPSRRDLVNTPTVISRQHEQSIPIQKLDITSKELVRAVNPLTFYTKQKPLSFTYYSRELRFGPDATDKFPNQVRSVPLYLIPDRNALLITYLSMDYFYQNDPSSIGPRFQAVPKGTSVPNLFAWGISATSTSLYDSLVGSPSATGGFIPNYYTSYSKLGENVLDAGSSSTTLYVTENQNIFINYYASITKLATSFVANNVYCILTIRGHLISMSEFNTLKELKRT